MPKAHIPQRYRILQLADVVGQRGFTRFDTVNEIGCFELASRIGELEAEGVRFERETQSGSNRFGDAVHFTRYRLAEVPPGVRARWLTPLFGRHAPLAMPVEGPVS